MSGLDQQIAFLVESDRLNTVLRRNYTVAADRRENSAEHSWHVALTAMLLAEYSNQPVNIDRVVRMLLVHDLVEIDAGDTFIYDSVANISKEAREREAARRLFGLLPESQAGQLHELWDEFETKATPEAKFARAVDRFVAVLHNYATRGRGWKENGITRSRVLEVNQSVAEGSETLWAKIQEMTQEAVKRGDLIE
jgi:5'-deoxynucleotidase YfbR-like HD superfamily hydrolase